MAQIHQLKNHPKLRMLSRRLNLPLPYAMGLLLHMWRHGYKTESDLIGTPRDVERAAEWPGKPGKFFEAASRFWIEERSGVWHSRELYKFAPDNVRRRVFGRERRRTAVHIRRARLANARIGRYGKKEWRETVLYCNGHCTHCHKPFNNLEIEHVIPLSRGGSHSTENILASCKGCNMSKGAKSVLSFVTGFKIGGSK